MNHIFWGYLDRHDRLWCINIRGPRALSAFDGQVLSWPNPNLQPHPTPSHSWMSWAVKCSNSPPQSIQHASGEKHPHEGSCWVGQTWRRRSGGAYGEKPSTSHWLTHQDGLGQAWANYSPGAVCGLLSFIALPSEFEEIILIVIKTKNYFKLLYCFSFLRDISMQSETLWGFKSPSHQILSTISTKAWNKNLSWSPTTFSFSLKCL